MQLVFSASFTFILPSGFILCLSAIPEYKLIRTLRSLPSKRFCAVYERRMRNKSQRPREKWHEQKSGDGVRKKGRKPSPPPPLSFIFWFSFHFSRGQNRKSPFAPKPNGNAYATQAKNFTSRESLITDIHKRRVKQVGNIERFSSNKQFGWECGEWNRKLEFSKKIFLD